MPESPTESARAQGAPPEPPIGKPIPIEDPQAPDAPRESPSSDGENVVITPQTAGSAGAAHTQES